MKNNELMKIYNSLVRDHHIKADFYLTPKILMKYLKLDCSIEDLEYIGPLIEIKKIIEDETGFFCKNIHSGIYIFPYEQSAKFSRRRRQKLKKIAERNEKMLLKTDVNKICSERDKQIILHEITISVMLNRNVNNHRKESLD